SMGRGFRVDATGWSRSSPRRRTNDTERAPHGCRRPSPRVLPDLHDGDTRRRPGGVHRRVPDRVEAAAVKILALDLSLTATGWAITPDHFGTERAAGTFTGVE